jgi:hypothetical protein
MIHDRIARLSKDTVIIEGGALGADRQARITAQARGLAVATVEANWEYYGRRPAGPIRNGWMLKLVPDLVIAFHDDLEHSKGTKDMVTRARKAGIPVEVLTHEST